MAIEVIGTGDAIARLEAPATTEIAISDAVSIYKHIASLIDELKSIQTECKSVIAEVVEETGQEKATTEAGQYYITKQSESVRINTKDLLKVCEYDHDLAGKIAPFLKATKTGGNLVIK